MHPSPSSQGPLVGTDEHPRTGSQSSAVHGLPSSTQLVGAPWHAPVASHWSALVQASESLHAVPTEGVCPHAPEGAHASAVQALPSSHATVPVHVRLVDELTHTSFVVQLRPSSQIAPGVGENVHPAVVSQASAVQGSPSLHVRGVPPLQAALASHVVLSVQALPSSQLAPAVIAHVNDAHVRQSPHATLVAHVASAAEKSARQSSVSVVGLRRTATRSLPGVGVSDVMPA